MTPQITCAGALPGKMGKHENCIFHSNARNSALPEFNQSLLNFFYLSDSQLILTLLYDSHVINAFSLGDMVEEKVSQEHCSSCTVLHAQCTTEPFAGTLCIYHKHKNGGVRTFCDIEIEEIAVQHGLDTSRNDGD